MCTNGIMAETCVAKIGVHSAIDNTLIRMTLLFQYDSALQSLSSNLYFDLHQTLTIAKCERRNAWRRAKSKRYLHPTVLFLLPTQVVTPQRNCSGFESVSIYVYELLDLSPCSRRAKQCGRLAQIIWSRHDSVFGNRLVKVVDVPHLIRTPGFQPQ
jgi:hypothetical protein